MARQVRPWSDKPDFNRAPRVRDSVEDSTSIFHQGQEASASINSPDLWLQSPPANHHGLKAWQTRGDHLCSRSIACRKPGHEKERSVGAPLGWISPLALLPCLDPRLACGRAVPEAKRLASGFDDMAVMRYPRLLFGFCREGLTGRLGVVNSSANAYRGLKIIFNLS